MLSSLIVILFLQGCSGYRSYRDSIPNGRAVPHPCVQGAIWEGVGHQNQAGAAERNPFGRDFGLNGKVRLLLKKSTDELVLRLPFFSIDARCHTWWENQR